MRSTFSVPATAGAIAALAGTCAGLLTRTTHHDPPALVALGASTGSVAFAQAHREAESLGFTAGEAREERVAGPGRWGLWTQEISVGADECVALVIAAKEGRGAPRMGGMFVSGGDAETSFDAPARAHGEIPGRATPSWISTYRTERFAMTLFACARRPRVVQARVLLESFDGYRPARGADATVRWEVLRRPRARAGGMTALGPVRWHEAGIRPLLAEIEDPLGTPQRTPPAGRIASVAPVDVPVGSALLLPVSARTAGWLYRLSSGVERTVVNPRALTHKPEDVQVIRAAFAAARRGVLPGATVPSTTVPSTTADATQVPHDAVMDVGRNDFRRIIAVVDPVALGLECTTLTLARDQGLFTPSLRRTVFDVRALGRTHLEHTEEHVVTDRVCARDGIVVYSADVDDHARYRVSIWASAPLPTPVSKPNAPRTARAAEARPSP